jgi:hypothetical protein
MDLFIVKSNASNETECQNPKTMTNPRISSHRRNTERIKSLVIPKNIKESSSFPTQSPHSSALEMFSLVLEETFGWRLPKDSISSLAAALQEKMTNKIQCSMHDLHDLVDQTVKIINQCENQNRKEFQICFGDKRFVVNVNNCDIPVIDKESFAFMFEKTAKNMGKSKKIKDCSLPKSIIDYCGRYENDMKNAFEDLKLTEQKHKPQLISYNSPEISFNSRYLTAKKHQNEQQILSAELDWQISELKFLNSQLKSRRSSLISKESEYKESLSSLKSRRISIALDYEKIEKENEKIEEFKEKLKNLLENLLNTIEEVLNPPKNEIYDGESPTRTGKTMKLEIERLQQEQQKLERICKSRPPDEEEIYFSQIYKIKTRISNLKSISAIKEALSTTQSVKNMMTNFNKVYSCKATRAQRPFSLSFSQISTPSPQKRPESRTIKLAPALLLDVKNERSASVDKKNEDSSTRNQFLSQKEAKLLAKEEELEWREENILQLLEENEGKTSKKLENSLFAIVHAKKAYESRLHVLETKIIETEKIRSQFFAKQDELSILKSELEENNFSLQQMKETLAQQLDSLKSYIEDLIRQL